MNNTPKSLKEKWSREQPLFCLRKDEGNCRGRLTKEHAIIYAGRQVQEDWAILDICEYHHGVNNYQDRGNLNKEKHRWLAFNKATDEELEKYSKGNYKQEKERLNKIYGKRN